MDATWHSGPRGSATRAHAARCNRCIIHIYRKYRVYRTYKSSDYRKYTIPLIPSHIINPPPSFNLIRAGHVAEGRSLDRTMDQAIGVDRVNARTTGSHQRTWLFKSVITTTI